MQFVGLDPRSSYLGLSQVQAKHIFQNTNNIIGLEQHKLDLLAETVKIAVLFLVYMN